MSPPRIAVIGAGISGLAAARLLTKNGMVCTVFEKSRGLGGRMATREIGEVTFDHGVQYLRRRKSSFSEFMDRCLEEGHIQAWTEKYFVGVNGMTAPANALAEGLDVEFNYTVKSLIQNSDGWVIRSEDGSRLAYNAVLMAIPAPQAAVLLETADVSFDGIDKVKYNPCITLMLAFENQTNFSKKFIINRLGPISWISQNSSKPGRGKTIQTFVIHTNPNWSYAHLDTPAEKIKENLSLLSNEIIRTQNIPMISIVHKWKYAVVSKKANSRYFWNAQHKVGACGDYCIGASVESAFDSGEALASEVMNAFR